MAGVSQHGTVLSPVLKGAQVQSTKLDIGCGGQKPQGFVGIDRYPLEGVDVVFDIDAGEPWPFEDNSFEYIRGNHVIEHICNPLFFFEQVHRIARPNCIVHLETPHFSSCNSWGDPTHVRHYASNFLDVIAQGYLAYPAPKYKVLSKTLTFSGLIHTWPGRVISRFSLSKYEKYYAWLFPASSVVVDVAVLK